MSRRWYLLLWYYIISYYSRLLCVSYKRGNTIIHMTFTTLYPIFISNLSFWLKLSCPFLRSIYIPKFIKIKKIKNLLGLLNRQSCLPICSSKRSCIIYHVPISLIFCKYELKLCIYLFFYNVDGFFTFWNNLIWWQSLVELIENFTKASSIILYIFNVQIFEWHFVPGTEDKLYIHKPII